MGSPAQPEPTGSQQGAVSVTLDDLEPKPQAPKLSDIKLDGEGVPEELKGKSVEDVVKFNKGLADALKVSEAARQQMALTAEALSRRDSSPPPPPPPPPEPELTDEQIAELFKDDPVKAMAAVTERSEKRMERNFQSRVEPLFSGGAVTQEQDARARYPKEFELFGPEIQEAIKNLPNAKVSMSSKAAWDDLVSWVRGKPGNFERLAEAKAAPVQAKTAEDARRTQAESIGFQSSGGPVNRIPQSVGQLDATQLEIARGLDMTPEEYVTWSKTT